MSTAWERIRPVRASDEIARQIRRAIFEGRLLAGEPIGSENQLAEQFGVSRNTVRDALRALEATGVVEIRNGVKGGVRVAQPDPDRFADGLAVQLKLMGVQPADAAAAQLGLEWVGAELAASNATGQDLTDLHSLLDDSARLLESGPAFAEVSQVFHDTVARASGNWAIISSLRALRELIGESRARHATPPVARRVQEFHTAIYEAIRDRDGDKAGEVMRRHVGLTRDSTTRTEGRHPADLREAAL